jgi:hypothetical protein
MTALASRALTVAVVVLACVLPFGSAQAADNPDNVATATIQQDDGHAFDFAWDIYKQNGDDPVLNRNEADASARCARCQATAIAFQIVLVHGSPSIVVPQNIAQAVNTGCTACTVAAEARQFVRVSPEPLKITGEGRAVLAHVRRDLAALQGEDLPVDQLDAAVETQASRVRDVLATDLVVADHPTRAPTFDARRTLRAVDLH